MCAAGIRIGDCSFGELGLDIDELLLEPDISTCGSLDSTATAEDLASNVLLISLSTSLVFKLDNTSCFDDVIAVEGACPPPCDVGKKCVTS